MISLADEGLLVSMTHNSVKNEGAIVRKAAKGWRDTWPEASSETGEFPLVQSIQRDALHCVCRGHFLNPHSCTSLPHPDFFLPFFLSYLYLSLCLSIGQNISSSHDLEHIM